jgi:phosphoribosylformylglycinamidine cyclo-ligase
VQAGVNIDEGDKLIQHIRKSVRSTYSRSVIGDIGAFGAFYDARFKGYRKPVLVSSVDGVGTKLMVAHALGRHDTVGQDLVNHCVNDILVCGAKPLYFMDYFATGKLRAEVASRVISGFVKACKENGCALIGGETAEMPGFYDDNEYDIAGTIVGVVEREKILDGRNVRKGDVLIGLPSTGLHTNGYSLARKVLLQRHALTDHLEELNTTLGEALLAVHRSYLKVVGPLLKRGTIKAMSHITGGGIVGNTMRAVPRGLTLAIEWNAWRRPPIFTLIQKSGDVPEDDMRRTFNLGVGLILIVSEKEAGSVLQRLRRRGEEAFIMGEIVKEGTNGRSSGIASTR